MQEVMLIIGILTLIPAVFFIYDRIFRLPHKVSVEHGNVGFARVVSKTEQRNKKLALMVADLKVINSHSNPITLKEIVLRYSDGEYTKESMPYSIPTGNVEGMQAIAMSNSKDQIIIEWENIWEKIVASNIVSPGGIIRGSAIFMLDTPIDRASEIKSFSLLVRDFNGNESEHLNHAKENWLESIQKNFSLIDAPVKKTGENIQWEGVSITTNKPA